LTAAGTLEWYFRRLAVMPPAEVLHRFREQVRRRASRRQTLGWQQFVVDDGPLMTLAPLRRLASEVWPPAVARHVDEASPPQSLIFLGQAWPPSARLEGSPDIWTIDPVSGLKWPGADTFCFDVKWRREIEKGDVKFVLELNRLQLLQAMSARAMRDGDAGEASRAAGLVIEWMDANPPFRGVNWLSMIELSLRLVSVAFVVAALDAAGRLDHYRGRLREFVAAHAHWLYRFPSLHSSANNHRVAEGLGLLIAAELIPDVDDAPAWRREGRRILVDGAISQFHRDGVGIEQSPTYAAFTLEMILLGVELGWSSGEPFPAEARARLECATAFLRAILDEGGNAPRIGDDDEGRLIACPPLHEDRYVASVTAAAAGVLGRPELAPPARDDHLRDIVFRAPDRTVGSQLGFHAFNAGGYTVVRDDFAGRKILAIVDHGPVGLPPLAAHGHADALAVWLHIDDQPVLVDAGTYRYHNMENWRDWLRSTPAHNTLAIGGESQSLSAGPFNWRQHAECRLVSQVSDGAWEVTAEHDGYKSRFGCTHRRRLRREANVLAVTDSLIGVVEGLPSITVSFLFHPALMVTVEDRAVVVRHGMTPLIRMSSTELPELPGPSETTVENAYSGRYNRIETASRVIFRPKSMRTPHEVRIEILA
jgi:hypothetical protein